MDDVTSSPISIFSSRPLLGSRHPTFTTGGVFSPTLAEMNPLLALFPYSSSDNFSHGLPHSGLGIPYPTLAEGGPLQDDAPYPSLYSRRHIAISSAVVTVIMLVIVLGNVLVIVAVARDRHLRGPQNWFVASLAMSDILVGLFIMPLSLTNELLGYWPFGSALCQLWLATDVLLCTASILNLVLISLDRYWSITMAMTYIRRRTPRLAVALIAAVWALSMVICFPPLVGWKRSV